jgi:hypothetical protein
MEANSEQVAAVMSATIVVRTNATTAVVPIR